MPIDFTASPKKIVIDLINLANNITLTDQMVDLGTPVVASGASGRNTDLPVNAKLGGGFKIGSSVTVKYNRVAFPTVPGVRSTLFPVTTETQISDLVPQINARYGINLTVDDYVDGPLPTFSGTPDERLNVSIVSRPGSLIWTGTLAVKIVAN